MTRALSCTHRLTSHEMGAGWLLKSMPLISQSSLGGTRKAAKSLPAFL